MWKITQLVHHMWHIDMYWNRSHPLLETQIPATCSFEQIFCFLHVANSSLQPGHIQPNYDRLFKGRPLLDLVYHPLNLSIYVVHKQVTHWWTYDSIQGTIRFQAIHERQTCKMGHKSIYTEWFYKWLCILTNLHWKRCWWCSLSRTEFKLDLMAYVSRGNGFELYCDNYYTSSKLFQHLYWHGINACEPVMVNWHSFRKELVRKEKR